MNDEQLLVLVEEAENLKKAICVLNRITDSFFPFDDFPEDVYLLLSVAKDIICNSIKVQNELINNVAAELRSEHLRWENRGY